MAKFNGNDLVLAISTTDGSEVKFAHAQTVSLSFSDSILDVTSKDSNSWEEHISGRKSMTFSTTVLADMDDVTASTSTEGFFDVATAGSLVFFEFERAGTGLASGDWLGYSGQAIITSIELNADSDTEATASVELKVSGQPTKKVVT